MITFFRKARMKFIMNKKIGKYLAYMVGEIALVVIGILIALEINNWNEAQVLKEREIEMLESFQGQFSADLKELDFALAFYGETEQSMSIILEHLEEDKPYDKQLAYHFSVMTRIWGTSDLSNSVFDTLKSNGVELITNTELRNKIIKLYDDMDFQLEDFEEKYINIIFDASKNVFNTRFEDFWQGDHMGKYEGVMVPIDFEKLKTDQEFLYFLRSLRNQMGWLIERQLTDMKKEVLVVNQAIEEEITYLKEN